MSISKKIYVASKHSDVLFFNDSPDDAEYFEHDFGAYQLEGRIVFNAQHEEPRILSIHGARADYSKSDPVTLGLRDRGHSVLSFNMSGHSKAGVLEAGQTSLSNNVKEAAAFYEYLDSRQPKVIIGYSMGATPALKLLANHSQDIAKLILFYPGIYTTKAYNYHFGDDFKQTISQPYSYRQNDTMSLLRTFKGKVLLVLGEYDGLDPQDYGKPPGGSAGEIEVNGKTYYSPIPKEVIDMITEAVPIERLGYIRVPGCDHAMMMWMRQNPGKAQHMLSQINDFLKD